jgi:F-type H+-transporting ATPase subunit delta
VSTAYSLADRYAAALILAARERGFEERVFDDMRLVDECIKAEPALFRRLGVPSFDRKQKKQLLEAAFSRTVHDITLRFFHLLVRRSRLGLLSLLYPSMCGLRDKERDVRAITVTSALDLPEMQRGDLEHRLNERFGENCTFTYKTDAGLIGGFTVTADGMEIDCSIRSELNELKKEMAAI